MTNITLPPDDHTPSEAAQSKRAQGWVQSDKASHLAMSQLAVKHPSALAVLHYMIAKTQRGTNGIVISAPALARQIGIGERTAKTAVAILKDKKFVQILRSGTSNVYVLNSKIAWQGKRGLRYASFNVQLIVDEQEQAQPVEKLTAENDELVDVPLIEIDFDFGPDGENDFNDDAN